MQQEQGNIRLYGCGGFGINIVKTFESAAGTIELGHATPFPAYIDTSKSNLDSNLNPEHVFILDDVDGSGKVRRENHEILGKNVKNILQQHKPQDFNVVVFSASGGSGSVIGPLLVGELLARGLSTVCIVVGSDEAAITAQNTMNTLKSLEAIAAKTEVPVVVYYDQNTREVKRSEVDASCRHVIGALSVLCSKHNAELDTRDITNWVQFHRSTSAKPRLALFEVYRGNERAEEVNQPISIASLYPNPDSTPIGITPEYHCAGYPRDEIKGFDTVHFVITLEGIPGIARMMQSRITELDQQRKARVDHESLVSANDEVTSTGLVL